ncbi:hypothetical protein QBC41DRAFT_325934 [Cercophora samala]|uniref:Uncharacterized protein n=1 Tax=Cercophora samala TaxID=330535 RepID=A0AA39Z9J9_9PEZI|nr:hypothetical protein QBC41DRAFT_325934 [Cercophora samala]
MSEENDETHWNWWFKNSATNDTLTTPTERYGSAASQSGSSVDGTDTTSWQTTYSPTPRPESPPHTPTVDLRRRLQNLIIRKPVPPPIPKAKPTPPKIRFGKPIYVYSDEKGNFLARYISDLEGMHGQVFFRVVEDDETAMKLAAGFKPTVKSMAKLGKLKEMPVEEVLGYVHRKHPAELVAPDRYQGLGWQRKKRDHLGPTVYEFGDYEVPYRVDGGGYYQSYLDSMSSGYGSNYYS